MTVYHIFNTIINPILSFLSIITCTIMMIIYQKLPDKSTVLKIIFCICFFDLLLQAGNAALPYLIIDFELLSCQAAAAIVSTLLLSSVLTSVLLARICLKSVDDPKYDYGAYFNKVLLGIILGTTIYSCFPLTNNGLIVYGDFCWMQSPNPDSGVILKIAGALYINFPFFFGFLITVHAYYRVFRIVRNSMDDYDINKSKMRFKFFLINIVWQLILITPICIIETLGVWDIYPPLWLLDVDIVISRATGLVNCCIYFFIRLKRPEVLKDFQDVPPYQIRMSDFNASSYFSNSNNTEQTKALE